MKHDIKTLLFPVALLAMGSCSQDNPWETDKEGEGFLNRDAMAVEFKNAETLVRSADSRANVNIGDFTVQIRKKAVSGEGELVKQYSYSEMPEIVALPAGDYTVNAIYGTNPPAAWEEPYYLGNSDFSVQTGRITDNLEPVVCKLSNIRISISFGQELTESLGPDAKVTVKVGQSGSLDFRKENEGQSGYFAYTPGSQSITATFSGTVNGQEVSETKAYDNAAGGNHYKISFGFHNAGSDEPGSVTGNIVVDATVTEQDMTEDILPDDQYEKDDMRPVEGDPGNPDDPNPPTPDDPTGPTPEITAEAPIDLDAVNEVTEGLNCVLNIKSVAEGGIKTFTVDIDSETLTPDELEVVGLGSHLDMVNPGDMAEGLEGLGFPIYVGGKKDVSFKITDFLPLLQVLGAADHTFTLTVSDANGTSVARLRLHTN